MDYAMHACDAYAMQSVHERDDDDDDDDDDDVYAGERVGFLFVGVIGCSRWVRVLLVVEWVYVCVCMCVCM